MERSLSRLFYATLLAALVLTSCQPAAPSATSTPNPTETATLTRTPSPTETLPPTVTPTPSPLARRVLILSLDGLRPDAIAAAPMPNVQALMQAGAYSLTAQTIFPSATLPAHSSMLTGLCPAKHGVTWDYYDLSLGYAKGPSLFDLAHAAGMETVMVVGKLKLRQVTDPAGTDIFTAINDRDTVIAQHIADNFPKDFGVLFVHFPMPDMGDVYGWMSPNYLDVVRQSDQALGILLKALDDAGLRDETLIFITADHGGHDTTHGSDLPEDMTIPWVISGPGVAPGMLTNPINTTDTAATAAWALGLSIPPEWDGIPVYEAFGLPYQPRPNPRCSIP